METIMKADIFFVVSTVGFVLFALLASIALLYVIRFLRIAIRIMRRAEHDMRSVSDEVQLLIQAARKSFLFKLLFGRKGNQYPLDKGEQYED